MVDGADIEPGWMARLAEVVARYAGLRPPGWVLSARVADRVRALGVADVGEYLALLEGDDGAEVQALAEALRVGETRFFRHAAHVRALERVVVPELSARRAEVGRVRGWSAGCATGEEAWTLAMLLGEGLAGMRVEVLGSDLSEEALAVARAGHYSKSALASVPEALRAHWFEMEADGSGHVRDELRALVRFERKNLLDPTQPRGVDVILCRNVLIYFGKSERQQVIDLLADSLAPGGFLFLGYSETLRGCEDKFDGLRTEDGIVYQKPIRPRTPAIGIPVTISEPPTAPIVVPPALRPAAVPVPEPVPEPVPVPVPERGPQTHRLTLAGSHEDPTAVQADLTATLTRARPGDRVIVDLDNADFLADPIARVLRRAQLAAAHAGVTLDLVATRPGPVRFCQRHALGARR